MKQQGAKKRKILMVLLIGVLIILGLVFYFLYEPKEVLKKPAKALELHESTRTYYLTENNHEENMENLVHPFLAQKGKDGYIQTDENTKLYYRVYDVEDAKGNIVISHGFSESILKYEEVIYYFLKEGYAVFALDHRGHGYSTREVDDLSMVYVDDFDKYVQDFSVFMEQVVLPTIDEESCYLFGHSMGGGIGAALLQAFPQYFDKAVLSTPMLEIETGYTKNASTFISKIMGMIGKGDTYVLGHTPFDGIRDFKLSSANAESRYNHYFDKRLEDENYQTYGASFEWLLSCLNGTKEILKKENLEKIQVPVLLFQAENDDLVKPSGQNRFVNTVQESEMIYVPNAKHELYLSDGKLLVSYFDKIFDFYG